MTTTPTPDLAAELADLDALEEAPVRKVLVSTLFAELFTARADDGWRLSFEWGEPDADGFYTPTITATDDGKVLVDAGELRSLRARPPVDVERLREIVRLARVREAAEEVYADAETRYNESSRPEFTRRFLQIDRLANERAEAVLALRAALRVAAAPAGEDRDG